MSDALVDGALRSFVFGLTVAAAVGPIALLIVNYGVCRGFGAGFAAGCGAALADLLYAMAAFLAGNQILSWLTDKDQAIRRLSAGVLVLLGLWMCWQALRPRNANKQSLASEGRDVGGNPLAITFFLTLVNPLTVLLFVGFAGQLPFGSSISTTLGFALALFAGSLIVQTGFAAGGATLARTLKNPLWRRSLNGLSGAAIMLFGLLGFWP